MTEFWYNLSAVSGNNGVLGIVQAVNNTFMMHFFGSLILLTIWVILFRAFIFFNNNPKLSIVFASFFTAFLSIFMFLLSLVNDITVYLCWIIFAIATAASFLID